jgi:HEAT repeat protein
MLDRKPEAKSSKATRCRLFSIDLTNLEDDDLVVKIEAAKRLAASKTAFAPLRDLLKLSTSIETRFAIVFALSWQNDLRVWEPLITLLRDEHESPRIRAQAAEGLANMFHRKRRGATGFNAALVVLTNTLKDVSSEVRYFAAFALGASRDPSVVPALRRLRHDQATSEAYVGTVGDEVRAAIAEIQNGSSKGPTHAVKALKAQR